MAASDDPKILENTSAPDAEALSADRPSVPPGASPVFTEPADDKAAGSGAPSAARHAGGRNIDAMLNVDLRVQVILGNARMPISQLLKLSRGSVIELDRRIGEHVDVVINDRLVARGDLVKLDGGQIGVTLTEILKDYVMDT